MRIVSGRLHRVVKESVVGAAQHRSICLIMCVFWMCVQDEALISDFDISSTLHNELLAWQLKDKLAPSPQRQWDTGDRDGRGAASESRQARGGRDDNRRGPREGQGGERQEQGQAERQWSRSGGNRQSRGSDGGFRGRSSDPAMRRDSR